MFYTGTLDSFAPLHIVPIMEINHNGYIPNKLMDTPLFYIIGSMLSLTTAISPENFLFYPVQLVPALLIIFILFRKISGSNLIASLITISLATLDITGNKFFFWIHGMGSILFFMVIFLLANQLKRNKSEYILLIFISIVALVYTSYDLTFSIISLLGAIIILLQFNKKINLSATSINSRQPSQFFSILMFLLVFQLAFSEFVYETLIPQFQATESSNPLNNFLFSYLSASAKPYLAISMVYPQIISILGILKYLIIVIFILLALVFIIKKLKNSRNLGEYNILFIGLITAISMYIAAKFVMGQFAIGSAFLIGIFSIAIAYRSYNSQIIRKVSVLALISILVINLGIFAAYDCNGFINKYDEDVSYMSYGADWYSNYSNGTMIISDVLTSDFYYLFISKKYIDNGKSINQYDCVQTLDPYNDIYPIIQLDTSDKIKKNGHYVLNNKLNSLDLNGWNTVRPWHDYQDKIDDNTNYNKIYDSNDIFILS